MSAWDALKACREERACSYMGCMATQAIGETPLSDPTTEQTQAQTPLLLMWHVSVCCLCTAQVATKHRLPYLRCGISIVSSSNLKGQKAPWMVAGKLSSITQGKAASANWNL